MSIPCLRPVGFSAIITVAGKEWVTSDADKWGIAAEVVETMQNALAVLQFPLVAAPSATPEVVPASQDFAVSFAAELPNLEGDVVSVDPALMTADPSVLWVAPIISVPGLLPVGLQGAEIATVAGGDLAVPTDAAPPNLGQVPVLAPAIGLPKEENASNAVEFEPDKAKAAPASDRTAEGPVASAEKSKDAIPRPEPRPMVGPADHQSPEISQAVQPAKPIPERMADQQTPTAGPVRKPHPAEMTVKEVGQMVSDAVQSHAPVDDFRTPIPAAIMPEPAERRINASPVNPVAASKEPKLTDAAVDETAPATLTDVEGVAPQASEGPKSPKLPTLEAPVTPAVSGAPSAPPALSSPDTPVITSFWERYFTDGSDIRPRSVIPSDQVLQVPADRIAGVLGLANRLIPGMDEPAEAGVPTGEASESTEADAGNDVAVNAPTTPAAGSAPSPIPVTRSGPVPALSVLPWSDEASESSEGVDSALSSLPFLSSVSTSAFAPGPAGPVSLPVPQIAAQLAAVLVQASDRATELALAPEELGKVRLRIETDAANPDRLMIIINVERPETLDLFRRHAGELAEAIRNSGYSEAHINFGSHGQGSGDDQPQRRSVAGPDLPTDETAATQYSPRRIAGATLDLRL